MGLEALLGDLSVLWPELTLAVGAMVLLVFGAFAGERSTSLVTTGAIALLAGAGVLAVVFGGTGKQAFINANGDAAFVADAWSQLAKVVVAGIAAVVLVLTSRYAARENFAKFEYPVLVVLAALGMMIMVSARDMLAVYMGLELQSLALYVLAAFHRDSLRASEAGLKYFVLGALSSGLLLYGMSLIYGFSGETRFAAIAAATVGEPTIGLIFGLVFVICGLAFKVSAAPFHMWTPDVYQGAPTPATALFATAPKFAAMALFARLLLEAFPATAPGTGGGDVAPTDWQILIVVLAVASMTIGAFGALVQTNIKRLLAYSSIANMGFALVALAAAGVMHPQSASVWTSNAQAGQGLLIYMAIYVLTTLGVFACVLALHRNGQPGEDIGDLSGLSRTHRGLALALTALLFSVAGIPPFAGFFGKFFAFMPAWQAGAVVPYLRWLVVYALVVSVVAAFYYLRLVRTMWFDEAERPLDRAGQELVTAGVAGAVFVSPILLVFIAPLRQSVETAAAALVMMP